MTKQKLTELSIADLMALRKYLFLANKFVKPLSTEASAVIEKKIASVDTEMQIKERNIDYTTTK